MAMIEWFDDLGREDVPTAGGKGANLGEMTRSGLPVPPGFVVTVEAFSTFVDASGLADRIRDLLDDLDVDDTKRLRSTAAELQDLVRSTPIPESVEQAIREAYGRLSRDAGEAASLAAVRSSATVEDTADFSFAGMFESFLNVRGEDELLARVRDCWASAFGARLLFYRIKQGLAGEQLVAVVVQRMVDAEKSGVLFTADPATNDRGRLVIEGAWGLGEVVVGGQVTPDRYEVDKDTLSVIRKTAGHKDFMLTLDPETGVTKRIELSPERADAEVLTAEEVRSLAELGIRDERHYGVPQDAEWAIVDGSIFLVQTRPITTLVARQATAAEPTVWDTAAGEEEEAEAEGEPGERAAGHRAAEVLLHGLGASPGRAAGRARVLESPGQGDDLAEGEILVAAMTTPDWVPLMRRAAAVVTDAGGMTSHAAIVSRELGIPCVVGTREATKVLKDGQEVTVDGRAGSVLAGSAAAAPATAAKGERRRPVEALAAPPVTATRLYVNLGEPDRAEEVAALPVDGVGLLRAEFMILSALDGTHPRRLIEEGRTDSFVEALKRDLRVFASAFHPRPVIYRAMDFRTNEFRGLNGGESFEPHEENPMIGYRGCFRYTREPDLFGLELRALAAVRDDFDNLHLMIPFVRTGSEFRECKRLIDESGLTRDPRLELWVMAEVPSIVTWLEYYVSLGATGVSIGSNDLTQLVLGVDRDSDVLAPLLDERDRAVLDAIGAIIGECRRLGVTSSICGQAPSVYPEYVDTLVRLGIDSVSVLPDAVDTTRRNLAIAEQKLLLEQARRTRASGPLDDRAGASRSNAAGASSGA